MQSWQQTNTSLDDLADTPAMSGQACVALYDYAAAAGDELSIRAGEPLTVCGPEVDGWIKAANQAGHEGMVPASYLGPTAPPQPAVARGMLWAE